MSGYAVTQKEKGTVPKAGLVGMYLVTQLAALCSKLGV